MNDAKVWYVARGSESLGPLTRGELASGFRSGDFGPESLVFKQGMSGWTAASQVAEFRDVLSGGGTSAAPPPPPPSGRLAHEVDYDIVGEEMQFVEIELDPGEGAVAEAGAMMYMTSGIEMTTIFGDGSQKGGGLMDKLLGAGKRVLTGESLFMTEFVNQGSGKQQVAFASPYPGKIMATDLGKMGGKLIAQKDAFLCAAKGVSISIAFQKKIGVALFGGEGFIMQSLEETAWLFCTPVARPSSAGSTSASIFASTPAVSSRSSLA